MFIETNQQSLHLLRDRPLTPPHSSCETLSEALELYLKLKGIGKDKTFHRGAERNVQSVIDILGDRPLDKYSSSDAASFRDYLLKRGLTTNSVKRNFSTIRSIINLCIQEHGLDCNNAFSRVYTKTKTDKETENVKGCWGCFACGIFLIWGKRFFSQGTTQTISLFVLFLLEELFPYVGLISILLYTLRCQHVFQLQH